jgi:hypothetical protein
VLPIDAQESNSLGSPRVNDAPLIAVEPPTTRPPDDRGLDLISQLAVVHPQPVRDLARWLQARSDIEGEGIGPLHHRRVVGQGPEPRARLEQQDRARRVSREFGRQGTTGRTRPDHDEVKVGDGPTAQIPGTRHRAASL